MELLLQPLLERPGDPATLRVLSDALLEQGDPWGEAIRLSLELEGAFPGEEAHRLGRRRLERLQARYGSSWRRRLRPSLLLPVRAPVGFFRGIPSKVNSSDGQVARLLEGPVAWLDSTGEAHAQALAGWPRRAGLVRVEVSQYAHAGSARRLLGPGLDSLTSLSLPWSGEQTLQLLEGASWTPQLERLRLFGLDPAISPPQLERLFKLPLPRLRTLELEGLDLGQPGAERLAAMPWKLERLTLSAAKLGVKGTVILAGSKALTSVRVLGLSRNTMGPVGAAALATSPHLKQLVSLDLSSTASGARALVPFFESLALPSLKALGLASCGLLGRAMEPLGAAKTKALGQLTELDLTDNLMGDEGLIALSRSTVLTQVRLLRLAGNALEGPGLAALGQSALLARVEELSLEHNEFQDAGAKALAASKRVAALKVLSLGHNRLGARGLEALLNNPALAGLEQVREGLNDTGSELARCFMASRLPRLLTLVLGPETTTDALKEVLASQHLATLELLSLQCPAFDDRLAALLVKGPLAKSATTVLVSRVWCRQLREDGVERLVKALGPRVSFD